MAVTWTFAAVAGTVKSNVKGAYGPVGAGVGAVVPNPDGRREIVVRLTASGTYTTGGDALPALGLVGLKEIREMLVSGDDTITQVGLRATLVLTNPLVPLVKLYTQAGELANATSVAGTNLTVKLIGT